MFILFLKTFVQSCHRKNRKGKIRQNINIVGVALSKKKDIKKNVKEQEVAKARKTCAQNMCVVYSPLWCIHTHFKIEIHPFHTLLFFSVLFFLEELHIFLFRPPRTPRGSEHLLLSPEVLDLVNDIPRVRGLMEHQVSEQ